MLSVGPRDPCHSSTDLCLRNHWHQRVLLASRWAGYISFLPRAFPGMPLFWAAGDLQHLSGSTVLGKMTGRGCSRPSRLEQPSEASSVLTPPAYQLAGRPPEILLMTFPGMCTSC